MTLRQYLQLIIKHRYLLIGGLLAGLLLGQYTVATSDESYQGSVGFFISSAGEGTTVAANVGDQFALRRVNSYLALLRTDRLGQMIADDTGLPLSPRAIRNRIDGSADLNTVLLTARIHDASSEQAMTIAESVSRQFPELVNAVERPSVGEPTVRLEVVSGPSVSLVPVRSKLILASRAVFGLMVAAALVLVRELTDTRLHSIDRALAQSGVPLLGLVTTDRRAAGTPLVLNDELGSLRAEEYRQIRTSLQFVDANKSVKVVAITSSIPAEGKSVTAANLAIAMSRAGHSVVILDADLRRPTIGKMFGMEQSVGLVDVLRGRASVGDVLQPWGSLSLTVLPAGGATSIPSELLGTVAMARLVAELRSEYDFVIIDCPPLVPVTDASIVATLTDGVVLLVRPDKVTKAQLERSLSNLERVRANLLGIVGTMVSERSSPYSGQYYEARAGEDDGQSEETSRSARSGEVRLTNGSSRTVEARRRRPVR